MMLKNKQNIQTIKNESGFTIVELLIVVVVIAILAAITIVSYNGISRQAVESSMRSDLNIATKALEVDKINTDIYPDTASEANSGQGLKASGKNSLNYEKKPYGYCIVVTNTATPKEFRIRNDKGKIEEGNCSTTAGTSWTLHQAPEQSGWVSIAYGSGLFVAIAQHGTSRVMTSPNGSNWTLGTTPEQNSWRSVVYGNGRFVAVSQDGTSRIMTSTDGLTWSPRVAPEENNWNTVIYGNGLFIAASTGGSDRIMTSPDGINWTARSVPNWYTQMVLSYGNGRYVAVSGNGSNQTIMTSTDGTSWTAHSTIQRSGGWGTMTYGGGLFVNVGAHGAATSTDGITWTVRNVPEQRSWNALSYGDGRFVATTAANQGRLMTSTNGIDWVASGIPSNQGYWSSSSYGNGCFVAVASTPSPTTNQILRSCEQ